jgi:hypothetical protein
MTKRANKTILPFLSITNLGKLIQKRRKSNIIFLLPGNARFQRTNQTQHMQA